MLLFPLTDSVNLVNVFDVELKSEELLKAYRLFKFCLAAHNTFKLYLSKNIFLCGTQPIKLAVLLLLYCQLCSQVLYYQFIAVISADHTATKCCQSTGPLPVHIHCQITANYTCCTAIIESCPSMTKGKILCGSGLTVFTRFSGNICWALWQNCRLYSQVLFIYLSTNPNSYGLQVLEFH